MPALEDFYRATQFGMQLGGAARENRLAQQQKELRNSLAPSLAEGDYAGAAQTAFGAGDIDTGMKLRQAAAELAKADAEQAKAKGEAFSSAYAGITKAIARADALRARGQIDDAGYEQAVESAVVQFKPMIAQNPDLAEVMPALLQTALTAPPGAAVAYDEALTKEFLSGTDPQSIRKEQREEIRLGYEGRRVSAREREVTAKEQEVQNLGERFAQYGEGADQTGEAQPSTATKEDFFDPIGSATGPSSAVKATVRAIPGVGGASEFGAQERVARQRMGALGKDLLRVYTTNSSRVSNFDLQQTQRIFSGANFAKSAAALTDDITEARNLAINNYQTLAQDAQNPALEKAVRTDAQRGAIELEKVIREMDSMLTARKIATTDIGGKPIPSLSKDEIRKLIAEDKLSAEELALIREYHSRYGR